MLPRMDQLLSGDRGSVDEIAVKVAPGLLEKLN
jgi:hypothetical protein